VPVEEPSTASIADIPGGNQHVRFVPIADFGHLTGSFFVAQLTRNAKLRRPAMCPGQHSMERAVATGTVKWFNPTKGYGFIQPQSGGKDVFVHISALERAGLSTLNEGATVDYEIISDRGKESAGNLRVRK
jgi:cold shock protein